jgi:hypothetical protein
MIPAVFGLVIGDGGPIGHAIGRNRTSSRWHSACPASRSLDMGDGRVQVLEKVIGCTLDEAFTVLSGRGFWVHHCPPARKKASQPETWSGLEGAETGASGDFFEAADGIRTHDLLHGKQTLMRHSDCVIPAYRTHRGLRRAVVCLRFPRVSLEFWHPIGTETRGLAVRRVAQLARWTAAG